LVAEVELSMPITRSFVMPSRFKRSGGDDRRLRQLLPSRC
jgi:hypothetical protein